MKRLLVFIAATFIVLFNSCSKEDAVQIEPETDTGTQKLVFSATTDIAETKTALQQNGENYNVVWASSDKITIVDNTGKVGVYSTSDNGVHADFAYLSGDEVSTAPFKAYYPETLYGEGTPALPSTQNYAAGNISQFPMYSESTSTSLKFKNICGIIRLNAKTSMSGQKIRRIILSADQGMSGTITNASTLSANPAATVNAGKGVSLDCGENGVEIGSTAIPFHLSVPANNYTGLKVSVWTTEGLTQTLTLKTGKQVEVGRSAITTLNLSFNNLAANTIDISGLDAITIPAGTFATLSGTNTNCVVTVEDGATVTLNNAALGNFIIEAEANMILEGANTVNKGNTYINLRDGSCLTVKGTGTLTGSENLGIGGNGDLMMEGGTLTFSGKNVDSGSGSAAITIRNLTVKDGTINATGGANWHYDDNSYEGISCTGNISIEGGIINSNGTHGLYATGNINISGGVVTATGRGAYSSYNSGISAGGLLTISGGEVEARGSNTGSCPGIGDRGTCGDILITGGKVKAYGGGSAAGIGAGGTCGNITITGGEIYAEGGTGAAGIGTGSNANSRCGNIEISGGTITVFGGAAASAIGTGNVASAVCGNITLRNSIDLIIAVNGKGSTEQVGHGHASSTVGTITIESGLDVLDDYIRTDLSSTGTANCYIVPEEGRYKFRATVKGNGAADLAGVTATTNASEIASASLLWATFGTAGTSTAPAEGQLIKEVSYKDGYVLFSTGDPYVEGNAVVAIKNASGKILWSWHLWFTAADIDGLKKTYPGGSVFMDRNLGALYGSFREEDTREFGLLYQWGRKDPFQNVAVRSQGVGTASGLMPGVYGQAEGEGGAVIWSDSYSISTYSPNEVYYGIMYRGSYAQDFNSWVLGMTDDLWSSSKTIFDPCPNGWQVPQKSDWDNTFLSAFTGNAIRQESVYGQGFDVGVETAYGWFPSTGYRLAEPYYINGNKIANGYGVLEQNVGYHIRIWASDGILLRDYLGSTNGVYDYNGFGTGNPATVYRTNANSVRCVRTVSP